MAKKYYKCIPDMEKSRVLLWPIQDNVDTSMFNRMDVNGWLL